MRSGDQRLLLSCIGVSAFADSKLSPLTARVLMMPQPNVLYGFIEVGRSSFVRLDMFTPLVFSLWDAHCLWTGWVNQWNMRRSTP